MDMDTKSFWSKENYFEICVPQSQETTTKWNSEFILLIASY